MILFVIEQRYDIEVDFLVLLERSINDRVLYDAVYFDEQALIWTTQAVIHVHESSHGKD